MARDDEKGREALAQYIIRNTFSLEKITYHDETGTVIYRSQNVARQKQEKLSDLYGGGVYRRYYPAHP